jgi:hypothetical protein
VVKGVSYLAAILLASAPRLALADFDGVYCAGPGYFAFHPGANKKIAPNVLKIVALGGAVDIGTVVTMELPRFDVKGMMCRDSTVVLASTSDSVFTVHLDASRQPTRFDAEPLTIKGLVPREYWRAESDLERLSAPARKGLAARIPLMTLRPGRRIWLDVTRAPPLRPRCGGGDAINARLVERDVSGRVVDTRTVFQGAAARFMETPCPVGPLNIAEIRADSIVMKSIMSIESVNGRDSPRTALALIDSARIWLSARGRGGVERLVDRAVAIVEGRRDIDSVSRANILAAWGEYLDDVGDQNSITLLDTALRTLSHASPRDDRRIVEIEYELASAYRSNRHIEQAAGLIDVIATDSAMTGLPPRARIDRLTLAADLALKRREYAIVQKMTAQVESIAVAASLPENALGEILWTSADAYIRSGDYASAERTYARQLRMRDNGPDKAAVPSLMEGLAGLAVDQGYLKRADSLYREVRRRTATQPTAHSSEFCENWGALLGDLGHAEIAETLKKLNGSKCTDLAFPIPIPASFPIPAHVDLYGLSPDQIVRRLGQPYASTEEISDLTPLWTELGIPTWPIPCGCFPGRWDLKNPADGAVVHLGTNDSRDATRYMLVEPTGVLRDGIRDWRLTGYFDDSTAINYGGAPRIDTIGDERWLVFPLSVEEEQEDDNPSGPSYSARGEAWYDLRQRKIRPALTIPLGGYETAYGFYFRVTPNTGDRRPSPVEPGRQTTIQRLPLRIENGEPVIELRMRVSFTAAAFRASTDETSGPEYDLFTMSHRMTFVRRHGEAEFLPDPTRSDLSLADMNLLYDIPSTALTRDDVVRLTYPQLMVIARGKNARNKAWLKRLVALATDNDQKRVLLSLLK